MLGVSDPTSGLPDGISVGPTTGPADGSALVLGDIDTSLDGLVDGELAGLSV